MELRKIETGEIVTEPGLYAIDIDWYHQQCCDGPSVSSSGLRTIALKSPLHFYDDSAFNPDRPKDDPAEEEAVHFRIGRAGHYLLLEPHLFDEQFVERPPEYTSYASGDAKLWRTAVQSKGKTPMTPAEMERAKGIARTLKAHPLHSEGILGGLVEASLIVRDEKTGIWLKSRPDSIPINDAFTDLKLVRDASPKAVDKSVKSLGYDMQLALSGICFEKLTERTVDQFWLVCVESSRPHAIHVASMSVATTYWARIRLRQAIDTMAECLRSGYWPSYGSDGQEVAPNPYDVEIWEQFQKGGLLPKEAEF